ncbi:MAG: DUF4397 domain-containing protein [Armatimonadota bacterium]|nr:DUF4397 domain-containing protein [Armatimonadota bacterium]
MKRGNKKWRFAGVLALCALLLSGCRFGGGGHDENDVAVRLINGVPNAPELSVAVDGQRVWRHSVYRNNTGYQTVPAGTYDVNVASGGVPILAYKPLAFEKGQAYTVLALGLLRGGETPAEVRVFADDAGERVPSDKARLHFINAAPGMGSADVLVNNIVGLKEVEFGRRSEAILLQDGAYDIKVNVADSVETLIGPVNVRLEPGHSYTLVAMGQPSTHSLTLEAYPDRY